jgi:poly(A) polymerase
MFAFQPRLEQPRGKRALRLLEQPRFRAAFDLLTLRAQLGLAPADIAAWWTRLQEVSPEQRLQMLDALPRARVAAKSGNAASATAAAPSAPGLEVPEDAATAADSGARRTRRRRRRRRGGPGPA